MNGIVYRPPTGHACAPGWTWRPWSEDSDVPPPHADASTGTPPLLRDFPRGTVWECECGSTWVSRGSAPTPVNMSYGPGMEPVEWKRESRRARRKRERQGVSPPLSSKPKPDVASLFMPTEVASLRAKFEKAQREGRVTMVTPYTESIDIPGGTITFPFGITDEQAKRVRDVFTTRHDAHQAYSVRSGGNGVLIPPRGTADFAEWARLHPDDPDAADVEVEPPNLPRKLVT